MPVRPIILSSTILYTIQEEPEYGTIRKHRPGQLHVLTRIQGLLDDLKDILVARLGTYSNTKPAVPCCTPRLHQPSWHGQSNSPCLKSPKQHANGRHVTWQLLGMRIWFKAMEVLHEQGTQCGGSTP